MKRIKTERR